MEAASSTQANQNQENGDTSYHVISFPEADQEWLSSVEGKIEAMAKLSNKSASKKSCCIFRVPESFVEINENVYQPSRLSIGPYHHGQDHLKMIHEEKYRFLGAVLARTQSHGISLKDFYRTIAPMEEKIRDCYSETIKHSSYEFIEMMILDGCFIIELFCIAGRLVQTDPNGPIFNMTQIFFCLMRDLLRLENQIPFFVLQSLFELSILSSIEENVPTLTELALGFFGYADQRSTDYLVKYKNCKCEHLLDLYRLTLMPEIQIPRNKSPRPQFRTPIQSALKLHIAGIRFASRMNDCLLDIKFNKGVLEIPLVTLDDFSSSVLLNCVAFEQCCNRCSKHITCYVTFMGCLINTPANARFLSDKNIIENYYGTDEEVAKFFTDVWKDVVFDLDMSYLAEIFEDVNRRYNNKWLDRWGGFKHTYFGTPWSFISVIAAVILLLLTVIQSFFAAYQYVRPPKS